MVPKWYHAGMKRSKSGRPGGARSRHRLAFNLRIDPELAAWLDETAAASGQSRTRLIERWLLSLRSIAVGFEQWEHARSRGVQLEFAGAALLAELVPLGLGGEVLRDSLGEYSDRQRAVMAEIKEIKADRTRPGGGKS